MESTIETVNPAPEADAANKTAQLAAANLRSAASTLEHQAHLIETVYRGADAVKHFANAALIRQIIDGWQGGAFEADYPDDLPFIAAMRGNLEV